MHSRNKRLSMLVLALVIACISGAFTVASAAPDAISASMNPEHVGSLGGKTTVTAVATSAGVPVANRTLQVFLTHALTSRSTGNWMATTDANGRISVVIVGRSQTGLPGKYVVTVRDFLDSSISTTTEFDVQLTGLGIGI
jgi:hypothetical protein